jgi:IclR family acetate operon transcriptional repressor
MPEKSADEAEKTPPAYPISSVDNALRLLLMFRGQRRLRLSDVASALDVSASTAHRLLAMLTYRDFVVQEGDLRTYVPGPALLEVGFAAVRNMDIRVHARPILTDLALKVNETVHLAQLEGRFVRYLMAAECSHPLRVADRTGQLVQAHLSATGKAMLAELPDSRLEKLYLRPEGDEPVDLEGLKAELNQVRDRGYATNTRSGGEVVSVATAVRDRDGTTIAAINASAPATRMSAKGQLEVVRQLHSAAARLEEVLRGMPVS